MAVGMSGADDRTPQRYGTIVVVGGGCYGSYYVRQLERAASAGALSADRIAVVDRDPDCSVARGLVNHERPPIPVDVVVRDWREYFAAYLSDAADAPATASPGDAIVPSPLMPHLMGEWLVERARTRWVDRDVAVVPVEHPPAVPWERVGADGTHYVSFATWTCPINCVEPRTCPVTRGPRTWSLPERLAEHRELEREAGRPIDVAVLHCRHRAYGVGMFDTAEVVAADALIHAAASRGPAEVLIGTVSHCHGALTRLVIGAAGNRSGPSNSLDD
jgi:hypothetical protein